MEQEFNEVPGVPQVRELIINPSIKTRVSKIIRSKFFSLMSSSESSYEKRTKAQKM